MKTFHVKLTVTAVVQVPDDFPIASGAICEAVHHAANRWCDGRYPYGTEVMGDGAVRVAQEGAYDAIFQHQSDAFGHNKQIKRRNAAASKMQDSVMTSLYSGGALEVAVHEVAREPWLDDDGRSLDESEMR